MKLSVLPVYRQEDAGKRPHETSAREACRPDGSELSGCQMMMQSRQAVARADDDTARLVASGRREFRGGIGGGWRTKGLAGSREDVQVVLLATPPPFIRGRVCGHVGLTRVRAPGLYFYPG